MRVVIKTQAPDFRDDDYDRISIKKYLKLSFYAAIHFSNWFCPLPK